MTNPARVYLVTIQCPDCGEESHHAVLKDRKVPVDQEVNVPVYFCPKCGYPTDTEESFRESFEAVLVEPETDERLAPREGDG